MEFEDVLNTDEFNNNFWEWFDELDTKTKNCFWYYSSDMAKFYFYNKIYKIYNKGKSDENLHRKIPQKT